MKKIIAMLSVVLFSFGVAKAGELTISGSAKASYAITSNDGTAAKSNAAPGLGISNEFTLGASGELDNGYTWKYAIDIDAVESGATNDDAQLSVTTPQGTFGIFLGEGGLGVDNAGSQSVIARPSDTSYAEAMTDTYDIDGYDNIQYHTPADLLPFGLSGKVAYATNTADTAAGSSGNNAGAVTTGSATQNGANATEVQVKAAPIDGLAIGASYFEFGGDKGASKNDQVGESGAYYATYATGPFSVGYSKAYKAPHMSDDIGATTATTVEYYDQTNYSLAFAASDDISVSYEVEKSDANRLDDTSTEQKSSAIQLAYTMGGMTVAVSHASHDNNGYVADANTDQTLFAVTMAF